MNTSWILANSKVQTHQHKMQRERFSRAETSVSAKCLLISACQASSAGTKITTSIGTNSGCFVRLQLFRKLLTRKTGRRSFHHKVKQNSMTKLRKWTIGCVEGRLEMPGGWFRVSATCLSCIKGQKGRWCCWGGKFSGVEASVHLSASGELLLVNKTNSSS